MFFVFISTLALAAGTLVAADTTLTGFAGADCVGSVVNQVSYPGGAGCHCDWGNSAKSVSVTGNSPVIFFATNEQTVCDPAFALDGTFTNQCVVAPPGFNVHCARVE